MIMPEATPIATPVESPTLVAVMDMRLHDGMKSVSTVIAVVGGMVVGPMDMFGYGIGTGPTGDGVKQTSGKPRFMPPPIVF
jgi:hypothetical protein